MTLVTALLASLFLALFFTPVLASLFLKRRVIPLADSHGSEEQSLHDAEQAGEGKILRRVTQRYEQALHWALVHTRKVLLTAVVIMLASVGIYLLLGSAFLPELDEGAFVLDYIMPAGTSLHETDRVLLHIEQFLRETPEIESYSRRTGARLALAIAELNTGDFLVKLKRKRKRALNDVTDELRRKIVQSEPAIKVEFPHILEDLIGDLAWSPQPIEIKVYHDNEATYKAVAHDIEEWLPKVKGVVEDRKSVV